MIFDLSKEPDKIKAETRFNHLIEDGKLIELTEKKPPRTAQSNKYLHVLFKVIGDHLGYDPDEMKILAKRESGFMVYEKNGNKFLKSTITDQKTFNEFVNWLIMWSYSEFNITLPTPEDYIDDYANIIRETQ